MYVRPPPPLAGCCSLPSSFPLFPIVHLFYCLDGRRGKRRKRNRSTKREGECSPFYQNRTGRERKRGGQRRVTRGGSQAGKARRPPAAGGGKGKIPPLSPFLPSCQRGTGGRGVLASLAGIAALGAEKDLASQKQRREKRGPVPAGRSVRGSGRMNGRTDGRFYKHTRVRALFAE